ncbi:MAG: efflux RND transporter permease subunit, partial [bacterium]
MPENKQNPLNQMKAQIGDFYRFTTTRPVAILMVVIGVVVFGWISYAQLPLNLMPDISYPSLTVRTEYTGTAPEEIETTISRPVEQALGVVGNLVSISSISKAGQSDVKLEFTWDTDMNQATSDVREKLDQVFLPDDAKRPLILRYDPSLDPIMRLGLSGGPSLFFTRYLAEEDIKRKLETIEGVAAVKVKGGLEEEIRVEMDEQQLTLIGINIQQVNNRLAQENVNLAGGNLREGQTEYLVRTLNEFKTVDEVAEVVIGAWNGREIKIKDDGRVSRTNKEREIITRIDGKESVEIEIYKEADANIVSVAERVNNAVFGTPEQQAFVRNLEQKEQKPEPTNGSAEPTNGHSDGDGGQNNELNKRRMTNFIAYTLPGEMEIVKLSDQSVFIENSIDDVKTTAVIGGLLAVLVLFVFLRNLTATIIVGVSIPVSIVATFAPMKIFDVSLNIMSLGGLALGIGMLVDNSIVVLESIARCREEGDNLIQATIRGVSEVGGAVFASTLTTIAVFFPIVFVEGVAGQIFGDMALTVVFSLLASLAVALFLIPMLSSRETSRFA